MVQYSIDPKLRRPVILKVDHDTGENFDDELEEEVQVEFRYILSHHAMPLCSYCFMSMLYCNTFDLTC